MRGLHDQIDAGPSQGGIASSRSVVTEAEDVL
jgi:hypothetical protein